MSERQSPPAVNQGGYKTHVLHNRHDINFTSDYDVLDFESAEFNQAVHDLINGRKHINEFPETVQSVYFYGQHTGHEERQSEIDYLSNLLTETLATVEQSEADADRFYRAASNGGFGKELKRFGKSKQQRDDYLANVPITPVTGTSEWPVTPPVGLSGQVVE